MHADLRVRIIHVHLEHRRRSERRFSDTRGLVAELPGCTISFRPNPMVISVGTTDTGLSPEFLTGEVRGTSVAVSLSISSRIHQAEQDGHTHGVTDRRLRDDRRLPGRGA